ncbi:MAG: hypothetical protein WCO02_10305 [Bacteroidota bacterium]
MRDAGCRMQDAGCKMRDPRMQDARYMIVSADFRQHEQEKSSGNN